MRLPNYSGSVWRSALAEDTERDLDDIALEKRVERYGVKPISDGITVDGGGKALRFDALVKGQAGRQTQKHRRMK